MKPIVREGTYGDTVLKIALECGCVSGRAEELICMPSKKIQLHKALCKIRESKLIIVGNRYKEQHHISINNIPPTRERLTELYGEEALVHYDGVTHGGKLSPTERQRWERAMRMSEVVAVMQRYGYTPYTFEKDTEKWEISPTGNDIFNILCPHFFTFREIKKMMNSTNVFGYTRINGILASEGGIYTLYNYGRAHYSWNNRGELNAASALHQFIRHYYQKSYGEEAKRRGRVQGAIVFGNDMDVAERYLLDPFAAKDRTPKRRRKTNSDEQVYISPSVHERVYKRLHFIPLNYDGIQALQVLTIKNWKEIMRDNFYPKTVNALESEPYDSRYIKNGIKEHVLCFTDCDLHRLYDFMNYNLEEQGDRRVVICYNWQRKLVERIANEMNVKVTIHDYETDTILSNFEDEIEAQNKIMAKQHYHYPAPCRFEESPYRL